MGEWNVYTEHPYMPLPYLDQSFLSPPSQNIISMVYGSLLTPHTSPKTNTMNVVYMEQRQEKADPRGDDIMECDCREQGGRVREGYDGRGGEGRGVCI